MASRLLDEIRQSKPFASLEQEALLSIERTAAVLGHAFADALKAHGLTPTQYNVLRILRGAGNKGLCRNEVRDRMLTQVPDVTRLLDRLEQMELVARRRDTADRRVVTTRITRKGLKLLKSLDMPIAGIHQQQLKHVGKRKLKTLIDILATARQE